MGSLGRGSGWTLDAFDDEGGRFGMFVRGGGRFVREGRARLSYPHQMRHFVSLRLSRKVSVAADDLVQPKFDTDKR